MIAEEKLDLIQMIVNLPEKDVPEVQSRLKDFLPKKKKNGKPKKVQTYEERLKELNDLAAKIPERENWDEFIREFDESRKDRPLPFRED
jgi:hypothetical protein